MQCMPVVPAVSQSTAPHAQDATLAKEPFEIEQLEKLLHLFAERMQCCLPFMLMLVAVSQSSLPHLQAAGLGAEPSLIAQTGIVRHLLSDA